MGLTVCTIVARNSLAHTRVLAESFRSLHPDGRMVALVFDDLRRDVDPDAEPFEVYRFDDLRVDLSEFHRTAVIYDVMEFATLLKPWLLEAVLDSGAFALYLDPDVKVYDSLDRLGELAVEHGIVLTPHADAPYPRDGKTIEENTILHAGIYNLGFVGVGPGSRPFLHAWQERIRRESVKSPHDARFVGQRWVDFVPGIFDNAIVRDPNSTSPIGTSIPARCNGRVHATRWTDARSPSSISAVTLPTSRTASVSTRAHIPASF